MESNPLPLAGLRVIAVEQYGAGPFGSMQLADMGAEVIKIENPHTGGDIARKSGPFFLGDNDSEFFQTFNRNKKSLTLDLKKPEGREVFEKLVATADIVVNNLRGDQPAKLGLDYDALGRINPKIVCGHLSAYGRDNDRADWPGYDYLMQAEAGYMALTGEPDNPPTRFGLSMVDFMSGVTLAMGALGALVGVLRGGIGRDVDVSLFDVAMTQLTYPATWYLNSNHEVSRVARSGHPSATPCQMFRTGDGWVFVMAMTEKFWCALAEGVGHPEWLDDVRFTGPAERLANRPALSALLDDALSQAPTEYWLALFKGKLPIAPVNNFAQAMDNPWLAQIGMIQSLPHAAKADFRVVASPVKLSGERPQGRGCAALGADTDTLLSTLGYDAQARTRLKETQVV